MEVINNSYWLKYAKDNVENSMATRNEAAVKLQNMIPYFWGFYTAAFTAGISFGIVNVPIWVILLLSSPIIFLIVAYWLCIWVQLPVSTSFDPRIPSEIIQGYNYGQKVKIRRFHLALLFTFLSAAFLAAALFTWAVFKNTDKQDINVSLNEKNKILSICGVFPSTSQVEVSLDSLNQKGDKIIFNNSIFLLGKNGLLQTSINLKIVPKTFYLMMSWNEKDKEKWFIRKLTSK